ncbi:unnamed protein product [Phaeothamnion confervicola]
MFGYKAVSDFLEENDIAFMIRAHEVQEEGFRSHFSKAPASAATAAVAAAAATNGDEDAGDDSGAPLSPQPQPRPTLKGHRHPTVLTVFSAPNYCDRYGNKAAILHVESSGYYTVNLLEAEKHPTPPAVQEDVNVMQLLAMGKICPYMPTNFRRVCPVAVEMGPALEPPDHTNRGDDASYSGAGYESDSMDPHGGLLLSPPRRVRVSVSGFSLPEGGETHGEGIRTAADAAVAAGTMAAAMAAAAAAAAESPLKDEAGAMSGAAAAAAGGAAAEPSAPQEEEDELDDDHAGDALASPGSGSPPGSPQRTFWQRLRTRATPGGGGGGGSPSSSSRHASRLAGWSEVTNTADVPGAAAWAGPASLAPDSPTGGGGEDSPSAAGVPWRGGLPPSVGYRMAHARDGINEMHPDVLSRALRHDAPPEGVGGGGSSGGGSGDSVGGESSCGRELQDPLDLPLGRSGHSKSGAGAEMSGAEGSSAGAGGSGSGGGGGANGGASPPHHRLVESRSARELAIMLEGPLEEIVEMEGDIEVRTDVCGGAGAGTSGGGGGGVRGVVRGGVGGDAGGSGGGSVGAAAGGGSGSSGGAGGGDGMAAVTKTDSAADSYQAHCEAEPETPRGGRAPSQMLFTHEEIVVLKLIFSLFDTWGKNYITHSDIASYAAEGEDYAQLREVNACMAALDADKDGNVGLVDYINFASRLKAMYQLQQRVRLREQSALTVTATGTVAAVLPPLQRIGGVADPGADGAGGASAAGSAAGA